MGADLTHRDQEWDILTILKGFVKNLLYTFHKIGHLHSLRSKELEA